MAKIRLKALLIGLCRKNAPDRGFSLTAKLEYTVREQFTSTSALVEDAVIRLLYKAARVSESRSNAKVL